MKPAEALSYYEIEGVVKSITPFGLGHINDTFQAFVGDQVYLLQRINTRIFQNPNALEANLSKLLDTAPHLFTKHYQTKGGEYHLISGNELWRLQNFEAHTHAPEAITTESMAFQLGYGFGQFTAAVDFYKASDFEETIPHFLDLPSRIMRFQNVLNDNSLQRNKEVEELIQIALDFRWIVDDFNLLVKSGLEQRICHNDAKGTNILFNQKTDSFHKIIDLDTVGPGYSLFETGDMIRSLAIAAKEGEREVKQLPLRVDLIKSMIRGYLGACEGVLSAEEKSSLAFGGLYMTYFTAIRQLTDYLEGDVYYQINAPDDNKIRAANHFYILELLKKTYQND